MGAFLVAHLATPTLAPIVTARGGSGEPLYIRQVEKSLSSLPLVETGKLYSVLGWCGTACGPQGREAETRTESWTQVNMEPHGAPREQSEVKQQLHKAPPIKAKLHLWVGGRCHKRRVKNTHRRSVGWLSGSKHRLCKPDATGVQSQKPTVKVKGDRTDCLNLSSDLHTFAVACTRACTHKLSHTNTHTLYYSYYYY